MWTLLFTLILVPSGGAQFPRACTLPGPLKTQTCCPVWNKDNSVCGEKSGRGTCEAPRDMWSPEPSRRDFRADWPFSFYHRICVCKGRFSGFDCGECKEGYRGPNCESWVVTVRLGLHEMDPGQRRRFVEHLNQAKTTVSQRYVVLSTHNTSDVNSYTFRNATVYDILTWIHYVAAKPITTREEPNFAHMGPAFIVWHRRYLTFFETEIRLLTKDDTFFLPYWDWTRSSTCNICTDELMGRNDHSGKLLAPSPFANWKLKLQVRTTGCRRGKGSNMCSFSSCTECNGKGYWCHM
ncbi:tyrosinase-like [Heterodontus francisci]|uniref:tyrosinase-like n=1 Tax=Heterodontus francisci TaxID=7792 RepID=UPI00355ADC9E